MKGVGFSGGEYLSHFYDRGGSREGSVLNLKRKLFLIFLPVIGGMVLILSGCFNMQSTLSYYFYNESAPASVSHIYVEVKKIIANDGVMSTTINSTEDLLQGSLKSISSGNILNGNQNSVNSLSIDLGPTATIVYEDGSERFLKVATVVNAKFYGYFNQKVVQSLQISKGQNKSAVILWKLSGLATISTTDVWYPSAIALDKDGVVKVSVSYPVFQKGYYKAAVSDSINSFEFSASGNYDTLNDKYDFELYPFKSAMPYRANVSIQTATETLVSTTISISASDISLNFSK